MSPNIILDAKDLIKKFGNFKALNGVNISIERGSIVGLAGPNGSGKTTFINVVTGVYKPSGGEIFFEGRSIYGLEPHKVVHLGINRTFQVPKPLAGLTVEENVRVAAVYGSKKKDITGKIQAALEIVGLYELRSKEAAGLTSSQQKLLGLARALATEPKLLFIDEIVAGLNQKELDWMAGVLKELNKTGITLVVVEHLMGFLDMLTDDVIIMNAGVDIFRGSIKEASNNKEIIEVFLGG